MSKRIKLLLSFLSFWIFLVLFKFGAGLHYSLNSPLGARVFPLWVVGVMMAGASLLELLLDVPAGRALDRFGYKKVLAVGTLFAVMGGLALFWGVTEFSLVLSVILVTIGWLFFGPGRNAYSLSHAKKSNSVMFMAYRDIGGSIGIVLACVLLPFVVNSSGRTLSIIIVSLLGLAFLAMCFAPPDKKKTRLETSPHERTHQQRAYLFKNLKLAVRRLNPASTMLLMLNTAGGIFYGVVWFVIPLIIAQAVYNGELLGVGLAMFDFAIVAIGAFLINIVENTDKKIMIFVGLLIFSLGGFLIGTSFGILFLVFAFLATTGDETASLPLWAWLHKLDRQHNKDGLISGLLNFFEDIGWAIGPLFAGIGYTLLGPTLTIEVGTVPILLVLITYYVFVQRRAVRVSLFDAPPRPHKRRHRD